MDITVENSKVFNDFVVEIFSTEWSGVEEYHSDDESYFICQRLSDNHPPLRIESSAAREAFPRMRSVAFLPPNFHVKLHPIQQRFRGIKFTFQKHFFETATGLDRAFWDDYSTSIVSVNNKRLELMMQRIFTEVSQPEFGQDASIEALTQLILVEIGRHGQRLGKSAPEHAATPGLTPWQLRRINERIRCAIEVGYPSLAELAAICGISQSHLMRNFKASTGWTVHQFIAEERLRLAKTMLLIDDCATKEIAARLGYKSTGYFSTSFRKLTGMTPSEFRNRTLSAPTDLSSRTTGVAH